MSDQIVSGGRRVFPEEHQDYTWVSLHNDNNTCKMYIGQGRVTDNAVHVESRITASVEEAGKKFNVNTVNHCIFCLRRTTANPEKHCHYSASADELEEVPCAPPEYSTSATTPLLFALNKIWSHLQKEGYWDWGDDQGNPEQRCSTQFTCFPKICYHCGDKFSSICKLMSQLKEEINKLGVIIRESKKGGTYSWRAELFEQTLKDSVVDSQCISDTLEFLGIPQDNPRSSQPASNDTTRFGVTMDTEMPSVITARVSCKQPKKEESSRSHFSFHDEDDAISINCDDDINNDPNYVKEEKEDSFSDSDFSGTEDFGDDPLDGSDNKPELDQPLSSGSTFLEISPDSIMSLNSRSTVKTPSHNAISRRSHGERDCFKEIKSHQEKEQQLSKPKPVCGICGKAFANRRNLREHIKSVHSRVETLRCDLCRIQVPTKDLYEHVRDHVGEEYLIRCPNPNAGQCSFVCCTPRGLQIHLRANIICRTATPDINEKYLKPGDAFICQVCGEDSGSLLTLRVHLNNWHEHGTKEFPCPIPGCQQRFSFRQSVLLHILSHAGDSKSWDSQPCDVCKEKVKFEKMEQHLKETHHLAQDTIIKCFQCPFLFSDRTNLVEHLYVHRHIALFCDICGNPDTTFHKHIHLRRHYFQVHQVGTKFLCEYCQGEFFSAGSLEKHLDKRHPAAAQLERPSKDLPGGCSSSAPASLDALRAEKIFKCDECGVAFKTKNGLTSHKIKNHQGNLLPCKFCNKKFSSMGTKLTHERKHRVGPIRPKKKKLPCQVPGCGKQLSSKAALLKHVSWAHEGQNSHVCDKCGKNYPSSAHLKTHVQSVHMRVRDHVCDDCGNSFSNKQGLMRHKLIHTGDRPFACQLCGQKFRHQDVLKKHVEGHERRGADFKPTGPMKQVRKRVDLQSKTKKS